MKYTFPAVFTPAEEGGYLVDFPDITNNTKFKCYTDGESVTDALENAADALNLMLWEMEEEEAEIPAPTPPQNMKAPAGGFISLVQADTLKYREENDAKAVKKTITIPHWMDIAGKRQNVNFSQVLQNALLPILKV